MTTWPHVEPHPIGVLPRWCWEEIRGRFPAGTRHDYRMQDLLDAVFRYRAAGVDPRPEWSEEFAELLAGAVREPTDEDTNDE